MGSKFTEKAEKALNYALKIAENYGHSYIGSEHLLLALADDALSCAGTILSKCSITKDKISTAIKDFSGVGAKSSLSSKDMTPRCRRIIEGAYQNSIKYSSSKIGTEHLLMSLTDERDSVAMKILDFLGADITTVKDEVLTFLRTTERISENTPKRHSGNLQFLNQYGKNLNLIAENRGFDTIVGRDKETERLIRILCRRTKNNPCLIGEAGVGKTAIVEGLAQRIADGNVPATLKNKVIYSVDLTSMVAGAKYRGDFEERIKSIISEAAKNDFVILFIDEIHTIVGAGAAEGAIDAANILKPELSRGQIQLIGATTLTEYHKYIEKDPALERRFQPQLIEETSLATTVEILEHLKPRYEEHHNVRIDKSAIYAAANLSERFIQDRHLPDKALDLLDEACAKANVKSNSKSQKIAQSQLKLRQTKEDKENAIKNKNFKLAVGLSELEQIYREDSYINIGEPSPERAVITDENIKDIVTEISGIPLKNISEIEDYNELEATLSNSVIGQTDAVKKLTEAVFRGKIGINNPNRPRGVFLFLGESGVGKTELAKALSEALFYTPKALIRLDMSEYGESHAVSKIIGSPPGYVGYEEGGALTEKIRRHAYSVVLFDEIEKASDEVLNLLLQIMDDGTLTDSMGRRVSFKNSFVIMTSNVGADGFDKKGITGFLASEKENDVSVINNLLKKHFKPEFINRIDEIIPFRKLNIGDLEKITEKLVDELKKRLKNIGAVIDVEDGVIRRIAEEGAKFAMGARPIGRLITTEIENKISKAILSSNKNDTISLSVFLENGEIGVSPKNSFALPNK